MAYANHWPTGLTSYPTSPKATSTRSQHPLASSSSDEFENRAQIALEALRELATTVADRWCAHNQMNSAPSGALCVPAGKQPASSRGHGGAGLRCGPRTRSGRKRAASWRRTRRRLLGLHEKAPRPQSLSLRNSWPSDYRMTTATRTATASSGWRGCRKRRLSTSRNPSRLRPRRFGIRLRRRRLRS
jgi:hypothetical protein